MPKKAKGGGEAMSKKAVQKKKQQAIEDKTFGLKNKNKSKKVSIIFLSSISRGFPWVLAHLVHDFPSL